MNLLGHWLAIPRSPFRLVDVVVQFLGSGGGEVVVGGGD